MWQGLRTICSFGNKSSAEVRADPLLAEKLNTFYGRFECNGGSARKQQTEQCWSCYHRVVGRGSEGTKESELQESSLTWWDSLSLATSVVPTSFKKSVIIPVPKNSKPSCLNDYRPVALTSTVMKVFERLLKNHICSSTPATLDPLQLAYRPNRSTDDAISQVLHSYLTHIDNKYGNYVRLLFIDYSSAFNTIVPSS